MKRFLRKGEGYIYIYIYITGTAVYAGVYILSYYI